MSKDDLAQVYKEYKYLIIAYLCFLLSYVILFIGFKTWTHRLFDKIFYGGFGLSLSSSLLGSLIVFGILGFIGIVIPTRLSTKKPEDDVFESRVKALMNGSHVKGNKKALEFLKKHLETYLVFAQDMVVRFTIKNYNPDASALEILVETRYSLINMCRDIDLSDQEITMFIQPDIEVNKEAGYISYLATSDDVYIEHYVVKVGLEGFRRTIPISVPTDSKKEVNFCYCLWNPVDVDKSNEKAWFYTTVERYTQNVQIEIINELDFDLDFTYGKFDTLKKERTSKDIKIILSSHNKKNPFTDSMELFLDERLEIFFFKPER